MALDRRLGEEEPIGDLAVREAHHDHRHDLPFPGRQDRLGEGVPELDRDGELTAADGVHRGRELFGEIVEGVVAVRPQGPDATEPDRAAAIALAIEQATAGDVVIIAGKGHETTQEFADRTIDFDDRLVAADALVAKGWSK